MSDTRRVKEISLESLDSADRKIGLAKFRKAVGLAVVLLLIAGGGYAAFRVVSGETVASRFTVNKMNCPACVVTVKEVTGKLPGVVGADISLAAQDVIVKFRNNSTNPEQIKQAIEKAGYPVRLDGTFKESGAGIDEAVVAEVNGRPIFGKDLKISLNVADPADKDRKPADALFSTVGKSILLQEADRKVIVVQPSEIEKEVADIAQKIGASPDEFMAAMAARFGSKEKYFQVVGQRLGIRKLIEEYVVNGVQDPQDRKRKTLEWVGSIFKDSDISVLDPSFKQTMVAAAGKEDWKTFWPRMIAGDSELKTLLVQ